MGEGGEGRDEVVGLGDEYFYLRGEERERERVIISSDFKLFC